MTKLSQETIELIVDVLTVIHTGSSGYDYASEPVLAGAADVRQRFKELMAQGFTGAEAMRIAKVGPAAIMPRCKTRSHDDQRIAGFWHVPFSAARKGRHLS